MSYIVVLHHSTKVKGSLRREFEPAGYLMTMTEGYNIRARNMIYSLSGIRWKERGVQIPRRSVRRVKSRIQPTDTADYYGGGTDGPAADACTSSEPDAAVCAAGPRSLYCGGSSTTSGTGGGTLSSRSVWRTNCVRGWWPEGVKTPASTAFRRAPLSPPERAPGPVPLE